MGRPKSHAAAIARFDAFSEMDWSAYCLPVCSRSFIPAPVYGHRSDASKSSSYPPLIAIEFATTTSFFPFSLAVLYVAMPASQCMCIPHANISARELYLVPTGTPISPPVTFFGSWVPPASYP